jgi:hypothetical protein
MIGLLLCSLNSLTFSRVGWTKVFLVTIPTPVSVEVPEPLLSSTGD